MRLSSVNHFLGASFLVASPSLVLVSAKLNSISDLPETVSDILGPDAEAPSGSCLGGHDFVLEYSGECRFDDIITEIGSYLDAEAPSCGHEAETELLALLGFETTDAAREAIWSLCNDGWEEHTEKNSYPWADVTGYGSAWDKEYYDGNTHWNEEHQTNYDTIIDGKPANVLKEDAYHVDGLYRDDAQRKSIEFPSHLDNFDDCKLRSVMCCWTSDRQANDNNGNCAKPYDTNCVDADPGDNTDLCAVDMDRSSSKSTKVSGGFSLFDGDNANGEGPIHCHGLAWGTDDMEVPARYKGNNLFYVSMYDHMYKRGYVRNVPGAPMCACVEKMPIVSRSDCTQIDTDEIWRIEWNAEDTTFSSSLQHIDIDYNSCQGANNKNNDLGAYYKRLYEEGRAPLGDFNKFKKTVVGNNKCTNAIEELYFDKGYEIDTTVPEGWTQVYANGIFAVEKTDPALWHVGSPYIKQDGTSDSPVFYVMRNCINCNESHKTIVYKRLTPLPDNLNIEALFVYNWVDSPSNVKGVDFDLFSSMEDALDGTEAWTFCNFNAHNIGFPRDCGPEGRVNQQWNSLKYGQANVAFYVWNENINIGNQVSSSPTSSPTAPLDTLLVSTPNYYKYRPIVSFQDLQSGYVTFTVEANNDAHIALGEDMNHNGKHYEVVLGGWRNKKSRLRGANQNPTLDEYIGHVLREEDTTFRISWTISEFVVEQQGGSRWFELMRYSNRDSGDYNHNIKYMMVATGWTAEGKWRVTGYSENAQTMLFTPNYYKYMPVIEFPHTNHVSGHVLFSVAARNDVHIALGEDMDHNGKHYEIVLGGWGNNRSRIRGRNQNPTLAEYVNPVLGGYDEHVMFKISWDKKMIMVERSNDNDEGTLEEIMKYAGRDVSEYNWKIKHMMIATGWGSTGDWKILDY